MKIQRNETRMKKEKEEEEDGGKESEGGKRGAAARWEKDRRIKNEKMEQE